jgi:hypothetical protein
MSLVRMFIGSHRQEANLWNFLVNIEKWLCTLNCF